MNSSHEDILAYFVELSRAFLNLKMHQEAINLINEYKSLIEQNNISSIRWIAAVYYDVDKLEESINANKQYMTLESSTANPYFNIALCILRQINEGKIEADKIDQVIKLAKKCITLNPQEPRYYHMLYSVYGEYGFTDLSEKYKNILDNKFSEYDIHSNNYKIYMY